MMIKMLSVLALSLCGVWLPRSFGQEVLFEDRFEGGLSEKWQVVGLEKEDYRLRDGALEVRVVPGQPKQRRPMLKIDLPFTTADTVVASVEVSVVGQPLQRGELAGLSLTDQDGPVFTARKTNIDGFFVFAPGEVDFIGQSGEEGDPGKYTVKYWPADEAAGPIRIMVRHHYAHFQTGPTAAGKYATYFHSAIGEADEGLGFGLTVGDGTGDGERWVRFDNFRVTKP